MTKIATVIIAVLFFGAFANASEMVTGAKKDYANFKNEMSIKLETIKIEIEKIREKTRNKSSAVQNKTIKNLEDTRDMIQADLNELEKASESNWKKLKNGISASMEKLNAKTQALLKDE